MATKVWASFPQPSSPIRTLLIAKERALKTNRTIWTTENYTDTWWYSATWPTRWLSSYSWLWWRLRLKKKPEESNQTMYWSVTTPSKWEDSHRVTAISLGMSSRNTLRIILEKWCKYTSQEDMTECLATTRARRRSIKKSRRKRPECSCQKGQGRSPNSISSKLKKRRSMPRLIRKLKLSNSTTSCLLLGRILCLSKCQRGSELSECIRDSISAFATPGQRNTS